MIPYFQKSLFNSVILKHPSVYDRYIGTFSTLPIKILKKKLHVWFLENLKKKVNKAHNFAL